MEQKNTYKRTFQELAQLNKEILSRQQPVTLEQAKKSLEELRCKIKSNSKKQRQGE
jgi:hypothetical protein